MKSTILICTLVLFASFSFAQRQNNVESTLETINIETGERKVVYKELLHFEAPNWSPDGKYFIVNSGGRLYKISRDGKKKEMINTGFADDCNNDHGISPDGKMLVISHTNKYDTAQKTEWKRSTIYTLPIQGGTPKKITPLTPSFWHGWSPDGKELTYCAERNGNFDVYTIPVNGGQEKRLTTAEGLDDGPDYSHDGKYIYYNSFKTGRMHIWRMKTDGSEQEQITTDEYANWFAHPSPDGKWIVYISYMQDQGQDHPFGKDVKLKLMSLKDRSVKDLTQVFFGGQGTINVPSWSPDSKQVAFVSYKIVEKK